MIRSYTLSRPRTYKPRSFWLRLRQSLGLMHVSASTEARRAIRLPILGHARPRSFSMLQCRARKFTPHSQRCAQRPLERPPRKIPRARRRQRGESMMMLMPIGFTMPRRASSPGVMNSSPQPVSSCSERHLKCAAALRCRRCCTSPPRVSALRRQIFSSCSSRICAYVSRRSRRRFSRHFSSASSLQIISTGAAALSAI